MMGYHLTKIENLLGENGIAKKGLLPQCGERSIHIGDNRCVVCFTNDYYYLPFWKEELYKDTPLEELCVLTFHSDRNECEKNYREFSTTDKIPPEEIFVTTFYDRDTLEEINLNQLEENRIDYNEYHMPSTSLKIGIYIEPLKDYVESLEKAYQYMKLYR